MTLRRGARPPIRALRIALLGTLVLFVAVVGALFWFGRQGSGPGIERATETPVGVDPEAGEAVFVGKGFRREVTDGGRRIFAISADRILSDREDRFELENVSIELERESGGLYRLASAQGVFDLDTSTAHLTGSVVVGGPDGLTLRTEALELGSKGNVVQSEVPVDFTLGEGVVGRAAKLNFNLRRDRFLLSGNVWVSSDPAASRGVPGAEGAEGEAARRPAAGAPGGTLRCQRLLFDRRDRVIHADESVRLVRGEDRLFAKRLSLHLAENLRDIEVINARWDVVGFLRGRAVEAETASGTVPDRHEFRGQHLMVSIDPETEQVQRIELRSDGGPDVTLIRDFGDGVHQEIVAREVHSDFSAGALSRAEAVGGVGVVETVGTETSRTAESQSAVLLYTPIEPKGRLQLTGAVRYVSADVEASGSSADIALGAAGRGVVIGDPAIFVAERGRVEAPRILQEAGRLHAVDGVRAELTKGGIRLGAGADSDEPILVQSREAFWNDELGEYEFIGNVRAWQGANYLLADEMTGRVATEVVTARGAVRTVWEIEPEEPSAEGSGPVEVTAESMHYDAPHRKITYEGSVHAEQEGRNLWCDRMDGFLLEGGGFDTLNCSGATRIEDPSDGTTVVGDGAIYEPGSDRVVVSGDPVILTKSDGTEIRGDRLVYDLENGTAQVQLIEQPVAESSDDSVPEEATPETDHVDTIVGS